MSVRAGPDVPPARGDIRRLSAALVLLAALSVGLGVVAASLRRTFATRERFSGVLVGVLAGEEAREALARRVLAGAARALDRPLPDGGRPEVVRALADVLGGDLVRSGLEALGAAAWALLVDCGDDDLVFDATQARDGLRPWAEEHAPTLAAALEATPTPLRVVVARGADLPTLAPLLLRLQRLAWALLGLGLLLGALGVFLARERGRAALALVGAIGAAQLGLAGLLALLPGLAALRATQADAAVLVRAATRAVTGPAAEHSLLLAAAALVVLLVVLLVGLRARGGPGKASPPSTPPA